MTRANLTKAGWHGHAPLRDHVLLTAPSSPPLSAYCVTYEGGMVTRRCVTMCLEQHLARHCDMVTQKRDHATRPEKSSP